MSDLDIKKIFPAPGYLLIEPSQQEKQTASGIILAEDDSDKPQHGKVLAAGAAIWEEGVKEIQSPAKVGQLVLYKKWGGNEVKIADIEYQFLKFEDILAIVGK